MLNSRLQIVKESIVQVFLDNNFFFSFFGSIGFGLFYIGLMAHNN